MCGRLAYYYDPSKCHDVPLLQKLPPFRPEYNVPPTRPIPVLLNNGNADLVYWGLIPPNAENDKFHPFNARAESLAEKWPFIEPYKTKRCLIIVSGFYEPHEFTEDQYYFKPVDRSFFALAGLWEVWSPKGQPAMRTCTVITTRPNEVVKPIHKRMPVILDSSDFNLWLDQSIVSRKALDHLLVPYKGKMDHYQVAPAVKKADYNFPDCVEPYDPPSVQLHF